MMAANKKDLLWIVTVSILILVGSSIPTWVGYQTQTKELRFRGIYYDSHDYAAHVAMMEAGRHGEWTYQFRFTTESFEPAYVRLFYLFLGHISRLLKLSSELTFFSARWILGLIALLALYRLMRQIFSDIFWARVAFLLAALGSGLGWLQLIFNVTSSEITPIDFWLVDSYVFFSLSVFPHFAFVTAAMCMVVSLWLDFLKTLRGINIVWIAILAVLVQFTIPIAFATVDAGLLGATLFVWWRKKKDYLCYLLALGVVAVVQLPLFVYNIMVLSRDSLWSEYTRQHQTLSPPADYYFWGFALFWLAAIGGGAQAFREKSAALGAAIFWIACAFLLAYAPLYTQQRFLQNITIPLAILAVAGIRACFEQQTSLHTQWEQWKTRLILVYIFLASLSSILLAIGRTLYLQTYPQDFFYPASLDQAAEWLRQHADYNDFVLASEQTSQVLAQKAGVRVYFGHEMETLDYERKKEEVQSFFQGAAHELASEPIKWVIYGPAERLRPNFLAPANLELVYDNSELQIYRVK